MCVCVCVCACVCVRACFFVQVVFCILATVPPITVRRVTPSVYSVNCTKFFIEMCPSASEGGEVLCSYDHDLSLLSYDEVSILTPPSTIPRHAHKEKAEIWVTN